MIASFSLANDNVNEPRTGVRAGAGDRVEALRVDIPLLFRFEPLAADD